MCCIVMVSSFSSSPRRMSKSSIRGRPVHCSRGVRAVHGDRQWGRQGAVRGLKWASSRNGFFRQRQDPLHVPHSLTCQPERFLGVLPSTDLQVGVQLRSQMNHSYEVAAPPRAASSAPRPRRSRSPPVHDHGMPAAESAASLRAQTRRSRSARTRFSRTPKTTNGRARLCIARLPYGDHREGNPVPAANR